MIDMKLFKDQQQYNQTSKYTGVSLKKDTKKWQSQLTANKKKYYGGLFNKEEDVAMKVNLLCEKYELKRKNPIIDIELFEDEQVRDSTSQYTYVLGTKIIKNGEHDYFIMEKSILVEFLIMKKTLQWQ